MAGENTTPANAAADAQQRDSISSAVRPSSNLGKDSSESVGETIVRVIQGGLTATAAFAQQLPAPWTEALVDRIRKGTPANRNPSIQQANADITGLAGVARSLDPRMLLVYAGLAYLAYRIFK